MQKMRKPSGPTQRRPSHASSSPRTLVPMLKEEASLTLTPAGVSAFSSFTEIETSHLPPVMLKESDTLSRSGDPQPSHRNNI